MGRNKRKNPKGTIITIVLLVIYVITLSYFSVNRYNSLKRGQENNNTLKNALDREKSEYEEVNTKFVSLSEEVNNIESSEEHIKELKEEVFKLASELEKKIVNNETSYKIAYLTFDDGPYHSTDRVIEILKKHKIKATFFTIGYNKDICYDNRSYSCAETYKKIVDNGHTIANHTYSHAIWQGLYSSSTSFIDQVKKQEELIYNRTGATTNILRFPGGSGTSKAILGTNGTNAVKNKLKDIGYGWVDWTAQDGDGGYVPSTDVAWSNFTGSINENIEVVLFHDYSGITISILPRVIEYLEGKNYVLLPLFYDSVKVNK